MKSNNLILSAFKIKSSKTNKNGQSIQIDWTEKINTVLEINKKRLESEQSKRYTYDGKHRERRRKRNEIMNLSVEEIIFMKFF